METECVLIHASFAPDGTTLTIGELPEWASPHEWYSLLCKTPGNGYQALAGGRGLFRLPKAALEALKAGAPAA